MLPVDLCIQTWLTFAMCDFFEVWILNFLKHQLVFSLYLSCIKLTESQMQIFKL